MIGAPILGGATPPSAASTNRPARRGAPPPRRPVAAAPAKPFPIPAWAALPAALALLLFAARTPTLGTPVADDYAFMAWRRFHAFDLFDSFGAAYYWRPVSRQLWFTLVSPLLLHAPLLVAALDALLLFALSVVLYRIARRAFPPWVASAIAVFPVVAEPARVLVAWPSGAQHALAMLGAALAVHEILARRPVTAGLAALAAVLSHESAALVLPALVLVPWAARAPRRTIVGGAIAAVLVVAAWAAGYAVALRHGVQLPVRGDVSPALGRVPDALGRMLRAQIGFEPLPAQARTLVTVSAVILALIAVAMAFAPPVRARLRRAWPLLAGSALWFVLASLPLATLLPDWNEWRTSMAGLGLGFATTGAFALVSPWLAGVWALVHCMVLLAAPAAPGVVTDFPPATDSDLSFERIVRLQRVVSSARQALLERYPALPKGGVVRYWSIPRIAEVGFYTPWAARVWYGDSTLSFRPFGGLKSLHERTDAVVEFEMPRPWPAVAIEPEATRLYTAGIDAMQHERVAAADSAFEACLAAQRVPAPGMTGTVRANLARLAIVEHQVARAESLLALCSAEMGNTGGFWMLQAHVALFHNDLDLASRNVQRCLQLEPDNGEALVLQQKLAEYRTRTGR